MFEKENYHQIQIVAKKNINNYQFDTNNFFNTKKICSYYLKKKSNK